MSAESSATSTGLIKSIREWLIVVLVALGAALLVRMFVLQQYYISGPSMESTLFQDNRVLVNKLSYRLHDIHRGDVVVFERITMDGETVAHDDLIKRVVALSGDTVEIKSCELFVNDVVVVENYLPAEDLSQTDLNARCGQPDVEKSTVPADKIYVLGDNRPESFDSRRFGPIEKKFVIGRAFVVVWPFKMWQLL
ncbi:MAG: signal peptidase I [Actinobacteria bacterium]|nr:signal peptidase I [Actinomycetota bacterium]